MMWWCERWLSVRWPAGDGQQVGLVNLVGESSEKEKRTEQRVWLAFAVALVTRLVAGYRRCRTVALLHGGGVAAATRAWWQH